MIIPKDHPRYESLILREKIIEGFRKGIVVEAGLIAHGRGEALDYLLGEKTHEQAVRAIEAGASLLLLAEKPVVTVNGNTCALSAKELVELAKLCKAKIEVNLFYRSEERAKKIAEILKENGAEEVYYVPEAELDNLSSERRKVSMATIESDVVFVALEDGDRTKALVEKGKKVVAIDLNPLSRTAKEATVTIVDNIVRALPLLIKKIKEFKKKDRKELEKILKNFNNEENLRIMEKIIREGLKDLKL